MYFILRFSRKVHLKYVNGLNPSICFVYNFTKLKYIPKRIAVYTFSLRHRHRHRKLTIWPVIKCDARQILRCRNYNVSFFLGWRKICAEVNTSTMRWLRDGVGIFMSRGFRIRRSFHEGKFFFFLLFSERWLYVVIPTQIFVL